MFVEKKKFRGGDNVGTKSASVDCVIFTCIFVAGCAVKSGRVLHVPGGWLLGGQIPQLKRTLQAVLCHIRPGDTFYVLFMGQNMNGTASKDF